MHEPTSNTVRVKLRHGPAFNKATLERLENGGYSVRLAERDQGLAEGQYAVFYEGTTCLGGGTITHE